MIVLVVALISAIEKRRPHWQFFLRKTLHIVVIFVAALASMFLDSVWLPILSWFASMLLWIAIKRGWFEEVVVGKQTRKPWGMVYFSVIYALLTSLPFVVSYGDVRYLQLLRWMNGWSFCILAFADGLAGIFGRIYTQSLALTEKSSRWLLPLETEKKSWLGFLVFWLVTILVSVVFISNTKEFVLGVNNFVSWNLLLPQIVTLSCFVAMIELVSNKGSDNLFVVLAVWLFAGAMGLGLMGSSHVVFLVGDHFLLFFVLISAVTGHLLCRLGWLNHSGAVMAWILAFCVVVMALWSIWPLVVFLGLAKIAGMLRKRSGSTVHGDEKEGKPRDRWQVLANGGLYMIFAIVAYMALLKTNVLLGISVDDDFGERCYFLALVSLSVSSADTLSSEVGQWLGGMPRSIVSFKSIPKGVSGGVTLAGFFGAMVGALSVGIFVFVYQFEKGHLLLGMTSLCAFGWVVCLGIIGSVVDSLLGDLLQAKYRLPNGEITDTRAKNSKEKPIRGFAFITNDGVNFLTGLLLVMIAGCFIF